MKRLLLLALAALSAVALAAPGTAAANGWTEEGVPITESEEVDFYGLLTFSTELGSIGCATTVETTLQPGGTGSVDSFDIDFNYCSGGGLIASCLPTSSMLSPEELPWSFDAVGNSQIGVGGLKLRTVFGKGCLIKELLFKGGLVAFPDDPLAISSITFDEESGSLETNYEGVMATASGTLEATPASVYGIDEE